MRIAFFTDTFLPQVNGIATSIANFAEELGKQGHTVVIFAPKGAKGKSSSFKARRVTVIPLLSMPAFVYPEFRLTVMGLPKVLSVLRAFKPDVIHFHTPIAVGTYAVAASYMLRCPLVGTNHIYLTRSNHDFLKVVSDNHFAQKFLLSIALQYFRLFYDACDLWIAPSEHLIKELKRAGYKNDMRFLPNGVPLRDIVRLANGKRKQLRMKYKLKEKVVLHFGRLSAEKNIDDVIQAFATLKKSIPKMSLLIIGDGPERKTLEQLAQELQVEDDVIFTGSISHKKLLSSGLISIADVFVTASTMESQGMVIVEAMASGLPVIAVKQAAAAEVLLNHGLLCKPGSIGDLAKKMQSVLTDTKVAAKLSKQSLLAAEEYSIERLTTHLVSLYTVLCKKKQLSKRKMLSKAVKVLLGKTFTPSSSRSVKA